MPQFSSSLHGVVLVLLAAVLWGTTGTANSFAPEGMPPFWVGALRLVMDPEVGMNIVDLGLIYRIDCAPGELYIEMTMTTPACPLSDMILDNIDAVLDPLLPPEVNIRVELVWDPPWSPAMMEEGARAHFGWNG